MKTNLTTRFHRALPTAAMALTMTGLGACSVQDSLLEQQQPQIILPSDVGSATGALSLYNGALGRLRNSLNGGNNNQEAIWGFEGLMTDEVQSSDSFSQRNDADARQTQTNDATLQPTYERLQQSRGYARDAINALRQYSPAETSKIGEMYMEIAFMELSLGQAFCNGIPLGETINGVPNYTAPLTDSTVFTLVILRADSAITLNPGSDAQSTQVRNAAKITKARAQVNLGQFAAAAATVSGIPTSYAYLITYSQTTQNNEWYTMFASSKRYTLGDSLDPTHKQLIRNAIPFYSLHDPRVRDSVTTAVGLDTKTPFTAMVNWGITDAISLVNGLDARLIEAEAQIQLKTPAGWAAANGILNSLRAAPPKYGSLTIAPLAALPVATLQVDAENQFFREKAFWQYGRGERFEDLRRLTRQYGRNAETVWPTGNLPPLKGGTFGTNVRFPVPDSERSNPNFTGCIDDLP